jgi:hypothetical protein
MGCGAATAMRIPPPAVRTIKLAVSHCGATISSGKFGFAAEFPMAFFQYRFGVLSSDC